MEKLGHSPAGCRIHGGAGPLPVVLMGKRKRVGPAPAQPPENIGLIETRANVRHSALQPVRRGMVAPAPAGTPVQYSRHQLWDTRGCLHLNELNVIKMNFHPQATSDISSLQHCGMWGKADRVDTRLCHCHSRTMFI